MEDYMRVRIVLIVGIMVLVCGGVILADTPSVFEAGLLNYYSIGDITDSEFSRYTPGVRMAFYITDWFGLNGDIILKEPFSGDLVGYQFLLSTTVVFRWPLGFFEPYLGIGPAYSVTLDGGDFDMPPHILYGARLGFDFNITPVFCLGVEANHIIPDIPSLLNGTDEFDVMANTYVGLALKLKL